MLAFAPAARIAAVMSFSQEMTPADEADMVGDDRGADRCRVGGIGGSFYLPYRLHARRDRSRAPIPGWSEFVERKRHYDPGLLFRNAMWDGVFRTT